MIDKNFKNILEKIDVKAETHIRKFSENSREHWARIGKQLMCRSVYSYILGIRHYAPNRFLALPNFQKRRTLANPVCESQFSRLLVNLCWECQRMLQIFGICLFSAILRESTYVRFHLKVNFTKMQRLDQNYCNWSSYRWTASSIE